MKYLYFEEEQKWDPGIRILFLIATVCSTLLFLYLLNRQKINGNTDRFDLFLNEELSFICIPFLLVSWIKFIQVSLTHFTISITDQQISYKFSLWPVSPECVRRDQIRSYQLKKVNTWEKLMGHRKKRFRHRLGKIYIMSGDTVLELLLISGEKILLGTQKPQSMKIAMRKFMENREER